MAMQDIAITILLLIIFAILITPRIRSNQTWSATITPLASIIGSGFLVSLPLLASSIGIWAVAAVAGLTLLAFLIGSAIRYNIQFGEPIFAHQRKGSLLKSIETLSHLVLTGAYFISVAYYLVLLSTFAMKIIGWNDVFWGKIITTSLILAICITGAWKGLSGIERTEKFTVSANLAVIAALLICLVFFALNLPFPYSWEAASKEHHIFDWDTFRFLMGLLIIVQGFEISRFMSDIYDQDTRIRAMKRAQITSSLVYITFFILMIPLYPYFTSTADVAGFIEVIGRVSPLLPIIVTIGAIASQMSAAVADSIGASGLISDTSHHRISPNHAYFIIGIIAILIVWHTDVVAIVTLASQAFALFYGLQCIVAMLIAHKKQETAHMLGFGILTLICLTIVFFGIPASG